MQVSHTSATVSAAFDNPNLTAHAGLAPVLRLAERCGLSRLVSEKVKLTGAKNGAGAAADAKVTSIAGGMAAGADSIDDMAMLRYGAMPAVFGGIRAPSTLGTFLRAFTHGHGSTAGRNRAPSTAGSRASVPCTRCWPPSVPPPPGR